jgi:hypothetical protein
VTFYVAVYCEQKGVRSVAQRRFAKVRRGAFLYSPSRTRKPTLDQSMVLTAGGGKGAILAKLCVSELSVSQTLVSIASSKA